MGRDALWRVYRAYWKIHPVVTAVIALPIRWRIKTRKQVLIRVRPDEPNPLAGVTDPVLRSQASSTQPARFPVFQKVITPRLTCHENAALSVYCGLGIELIGPYDLPVLLTRRG